MSNTESAAAGTARLLMIRHGESQANLERRFTLHDHEPLTELGLRQARQAGELIAQHYRPRALYSSPYLRARHTAREIGEVIGLQVAVVDLLHEQGFGELCGRPYEEYFSGIDDVRHPDRWDLRAPGGESLREVSQRVGPAVEELANRHLDETIVVVSHGGVMAALRAWVTGDYDVAPVSTENAGGFRLVVDPARGLFGPPEPLIGPPPQL